MNWRNIVTVEYQIIVDISVANSINVTGIVFECEIDEPN